MVSAVLNFLFELVHRVRNLAWRLRHKGPYTVWFLVPRYHTNMIPMVVAFQEAGDTVEMIVSRQEVIEDHQHVKPTQIKDALDQVKSTEGADNPDIVIIRDLSPDMIMLSRWAKSRGARVIHYTQKPSRRKRGYTAFRKDLTKIRAKQLAGLPLSTITPLDFDPRLPKRLLHRTFHFPILNGAPVTPERKGKPQILVVGKLAQPRKQHFWAIEALRAIQLDSRLVICGADLDLDSDDGTRSTEYYARLVATPKETELNQRLEIDIRANVPPHEMMGIYMDSDVFALPALNEEFGISLLEAMSAGCATITTDEVGAARHISSGINGLIVSASDPIAFKKSLEDLLFDSAFRRRIQENGQSTIREHHSTSQFRDFILSRA